eukprot:Blabericola_migrator_1__10065@NODE_558_length_7604_cov_14_461059_g418_i0_p5_GENE_NODE_558_length_7604_cov_14_461059_g418_i0NODE_558_length_7604_cov_14_461059_g418_i0_p5_ORF_typecomplete_len141_score13_90p47_phox_C/PF08944_11/1_4e02p47_phox_C/PF08944_11/5_5e02p47_phox_C/PF08944_11/1_5_NODE_558_length_7604_cov_14_461059_g418_i025362958
MPWKELPAKGDRLRGVTSLDDNDVSREAHWGWEVVNPLITSTLVPSGHVAKLRPFLTQPTVPPTTEPNAASRHKGRRPFYKKPRPVINPREGEREMSGHVISRNLDIGRRSDVASTQRPSQHLILKESERSDCPFYNVLF